MKVRSRLDMPFDAAPWMETRPHLQGVPRKERYPRLADVAYFDFLKREKRGDRKARRRENGQPEWYVDMSQSPDHSTWGETPSCFLKQSMI